MRLKSKGRWLAVALAAHSVWQCVSCGALPMGVCACVCAVSHQCVTDCHMCGSCSQAAASLPGNCHCIWHSAAINCLRSQTSTGLAQKFQQCFFLMQVQCDLTVNHLIKKRALPSSWSLPFPPMFPAFKLLVTSIPPTWQFVFCCWTQHWRRQKPLNTTLAAAPH